MRYIFLAVIILIGFNVTAQSVYPIEADTVKIRKRGTGDAVLDVLGLLKVKTLPNGSSTHKIVTWDSVKKSFYSVNSNSFSASLPSQTGNARKFLTTDATTASWGLPNFADSVDFTGSGVGMVLRINPGGSGTKKYDFASVGGIVSINGISPIIVTGSGNTRDVSFDNSAFFASLPSNLTTQGNTFNGANQLLRLNSAGAIPAVDGGLITGLTKTQVGLSNVPNTDATNAANITTGTLPNARLVSIPNSALANSSITVNGSAVSLGGSVTIVAGFTPLEDTTLTGAYTLQFRDLGRTINVNSATNVTVTIPTGINPVQINKLYDINFVQKGNGQIVFAPGAGMTMGSLLNSNKSFSQFAGATIHFESSSSVVLFGAITQ